MNNYLCTLMKKTGITVSVNHFIRSLREELQNDLPGTDHQYKMAPALRINLQKDKARKKAAVLILLYPSGGRIHTVLMQRTDYPGAHGGQVSLPGGKKEERDLDCYSTALRESGEEIGIMPEKVEILGKLTDLFIPVSNILVCPVVGFYLEKPKFKLDPQEVKYIIETPIDHFLVPGIKKSKIRILLFKKALVPYYHIDGHMVWGATAMIISEFEEVLRRIDYQPE
jgi:8-oxo-dGTP pyrophosphatase MutT (NUDIX family)